MNSPAIDPAAFRHALGHYPTGVAAITSLDADGAPLVLVVGTFTSISLDPPLVGFLPDKRSASWEQIAKTGKFAANVLAADQTALSNHFAKSFDDKWKDIPHETWDTGVPVVPGAIANFEGEVVANHDGGDHVIVVGRVTRLRAPTEGAPAPLLYFKGKYAGVAG